METGKRIINIARSLDKRSVMSDGNISAFVDEETLSNMQEEAATHFGHFLTALGIDWQNDPNAADTPKRVAKMYIRETMAGRYKPMPDVTAFPNEGKYKGMLVVRAEIKSMCSHHHQPVTGTAFVGIIPNGTVLGLSKYIRLAQWAARRGTLQESLTTEIANLISKESNTEDVAVYVEAEHGCCTNRGVSVSSSLTQTAEVMGKFLELDSVKQEFIKYVEMNR